MNISILHYLFAYPNWKHLTLLHLFKNVRDQTHSLSLNHSPCHLCFLGPKNPKSSSLQPSLPSRKHRCNWACTLGPRSSTKRWPGTVRMPQRYPRFTRQYATFGIFQFHRTICDNIIVRKHGTIHFNESYFVLCLLFDDWRGKWNDRICQEEVVHWIPHLFSGKLAHHSHSKSPAARTNMVWIGHRGVFASCFPQSKHSSSLRGLEAMKIINRCATIRFGGRDKKKTFLAWKRLLSLLNNQSPSRNKLTFCATAKK